MKFHHFWPPTRKILGFPGNPGKIHYCPRLERIFPTPMAAGLALPIFLEHSNHLAAKIPSLPIVLGTVLFIRIPRFMAIGEDQNKKQSRN